MTIGHVSVRTDKWTENMSEKIALFMQLELYLNSVLFFYLFVEIFTILKCTIIIDSRNVGRQTIVVHAHLPSFFSLRYFSLYKFKVVSNRLLLFQIVSSPRQAAVVFTPASFIACQYSTLFWEVWLFLIRSPWSDPSFTFVYKAPLFHQ